MAWAPVAVRRHYGKKAGLSGRPRCVDRGRTMNFFHGKRPRDGQHPSARRAQADQQRPLVAIALSTLCAAGSLREMSGRSAAPAAVTEVN